MSDIEFVTGLNFKPPNQAAPEYVKAKGSIKRADLIAWLSAKEGEWVNFEVKESKGGKWYAAVDTWKPEAGGQREAKPAPAPKPAPSADPFPDDDIPF